MSKKTISYIPKDHNCLSPYLMINGLGAFIKFAQKIFQAKILQQMSGPDGGIRHVAMKLGDSVLMAGEVGSGGAALSSHLHLYTADPEQVYRQALDAGAVAIEPPKSQPYGDIRAAFKDPWGNSWWVAKHMEDVSEQETAKRMVAKRPG